MNYSFEKLKQFALFSLIKGINEPQWICHLGHSKNDTITQITGKGDTAEDAIEIAIKKYIEFDNKL